MTMSDLEDDPPCAAPIDYSTHVYSVCARATSRCLFLGLGEVDVVLVVLVVAFGAQVWEAAMGQLHQAMGSMGGSWPPITSHLILDEIQCRE